MTVESMVQELIGCAWGRRLGTPDDTEPCNEQAVQIVVLHDGGDEKAVKLCPKHRDRILQETDPHVDDT